jgi:hypothetical protein
MSFHLCKALTLGGNRGIKAKVWVHKAAMVESGISPRNADWFGHPM